MSPFTSLLKLSKDKQMSGKLIGLKDLFCSLFEGRARLMYKAGFKGLAEIAKATPEELTAKVEHLSKTVARQIIDSAKVFWHFWANFGVCWVIGAAKLLWLLHFDGRGLDSM